VSIFLSLCYVRPNKTYSYHKVLKIWQVSDDPCQFFYHYVSYRERTTAFYMATIVKVGKIYLVPAHHRSLTNEGALAPFYWGSISWPTAPALSTAA